ncbi:MAG: glycosyltransferase family 2 protein [Frankiaceae bacterium]|jgi:GT2 family glycosyltransferase|nr:glycosyltransferase family 2 protein [Frankiaceae bacterium]
MAPQRPPGRIEIVIVNYRSAGCLAALVEGLAGDFPENARLTVWDNNSGDQEAERLAALSRRHSWLRLIRSPRNLGFGAGVNAAIAATGAGPADIIWILNPDTLVDPAMIPALAEQLGAGYCDVLSPLVLTGDAASGRTIWFAGGRLDSARGSVTHDHIGAPPDSLVGQPPLPSPFMTGAAPLMRLSTWRAIGGFREDLFLYWEDCEWSERAGRLGIRMCVYPRAAIWHAEGGSAPGAGRSREYHYYGARNRLSAAPTMKTRLGRAIGIGLPSTLRLILRPLRREPEDKLAKSAAALRGTVHGLRGRLGEAEAHRLRP